MTVRSLENLHNLITRLSIESIKLLFSRAKVSPLSPLSNPGHGANLRSRFPSTSYTSYRIFLHLFCASIISSHNFSSAGASHPAPHTYELRKDGHPDAISPRSTPVLRQRRLISLLSVVQTRIKRHPSSPHRDYCSQRIFGSLPPSFLHSTACSACARQGRNC